MTDLSKLTKLQTRRKFLQRAAAISAAVAAAKAFPLAGVSAAAAAEPQGELISVATSLASLGQDFMIVLVEPSKVYWDEMFDYVISQATDGSYVPGLATTWSASEDGLTWTFVIRDGVKFHNGDTLTAEDVAFSYNRTMFDPNSKHPLAAMGDLVESIKADGNTVVIKTKEPQASLPAWFAQSDGSVSGTVVSKAYYEKVGAEEAGKNPVGTGPYKFVSSSGEQSVKLTAFLDDGRSDWQKARTPAVKDITVIASPEPTTRVALLQSGGADLVPIAISDMPTVESAGLQLIRSPASNYAGAVFVGFTLNPASPANDVRVREALNVAIDRAAIAKALYNDVARPSGAFYGGPGSIGYPDDLEPHPFNPDRARELLSQAGLDSGLQIEIITFPDDSAFAGLPTLAEAVAGYYQQLGADATVNVMDENALKDRLYSGQFPGQLKTSEISPLTIFMRGFDNRINMIPDTISGFTADGRQGRSLWDNKKLPEQQKRLDEVASTFDAKKQAELFGDYYKWMAANFNNIPLLVTDSVFGASKKIKSWSPITGKGFVNNQSSLTPA